MNKLARTLVVAAFAVFSVNCAAVQGEEPEELESSSAQLTTAPRLGAGTRTKIASIPAAENQLFTSTDRLLITGDTGIFEIKQKAGGGWEASVVKGAQSSCRFGGIAESHGTLYVNCYSGSSSFLYASKLAPTLDFTRIYTLEGNGFANGLAADDLGRLYVAATWQNQILRLIPAAHDPLVIAAREVYHNNAGALTNGIAHKGGWLYWTDVTAVKRNTVDRLYSSYKYVAELAFFDDLYVDDAGALVTDAGNNRIIFYDHSWAKKAETGKIFQGPSSVSRALSRAGFSANALIVTERAGSSVSMFVPN